MEEFVLEFARAEQAGDPFAFPVYPSHICCAQRAAAFSLPSSVEQKRCLTIWNRCASRDPIERSCSASVNFCVGL